MARARNNKDTQQDHAEYWHVSQRAISTWDKDGCPLDGSRVEQAKWILKNAKRKNKKTRARLAELIGDEMKKTTSGGMESEGLTMEQARDYYAKQLSEATSAELQDSETIKEWNDLFVKADKAIRENEMHAKKLGIDSGEMLGRGEVERILKAIVYAGNACVRKQLKEVCEVIADCETPNDVYNLLPAMVLGGRIFEGMKAVAKSPSDVNLPQWAIDCMISEGENYFENGEI